MQRGDQGISSSPDPSLLASPVLTHLLLAQLFCFAPKLFFCECARLTANISTVSTGREAVAWCCCQWMVYLVVIPMAPALWVLIHRPNFAGVARGKVSTYESFPPGCGNEVGLRSESWKSSPEQRRSPRKRDLQVLSDPLTLQPSYRHHFTSLVTEIFVYLKLQVLYRVCENPCFPWQYWKDSHVWLPGW